MKKGTRMEMNVCLASRKMKIKGEEENENEKEKYFW